VAERLREILEQRADPLENRLVAADHQIERAVAGLRDARGHAGFERAGPGFAAGGVDLAVDFGADRRAVEENGVGGIGEQLVGGENLAHRTVVGDHGEHQAGLRADLGEVGGDLGAEFRGDRPRQVLIEVVDDADAVAAVLESAAHVGAHAAESDDSDSGVFHGVGTWRAGGGLSTR
jgi:hypothetical protein